MAQKLKKLTISQALRRRKKLKGEIHTHTDRLRSSIVYDEKRPPSFPFEESQKALKLAKFELIHLEDAIARANARATITFKDETVHLTWVLRTLAELKGDITRYEGYEHFCLPEKRNVDKVESPDLSEAIETPFAGGVRRSHPKKTIETVRISNITEKERAQKVEQLQREFEELNDLLETANHSTTLEYQDQPAEDKVSGEAPQTP